MASLAVLSLMNVKVADLSPLRGLRLRDIGLWGNRATDLSPLSGMPLEAVFVGSAQTQMDGLRGAPLRRFVAQGSGFTDLQFLAGAPLEVVHITDGPLSDLRPLAGSPVRELLLRGLPNVRSLAALLEARSLEKLSLFNIKAPIEPLRQHPSLKFIRVGGGPDNYVTDRLPFKPVAEFWAEYDAQQAAGPK